MKRAVFFCLMALLAGCKKEDPRPVPGAPADLAQKVESKIEKLAPDFNVEITDPSTLKVKMKNDEEATISLDNLKLACAGNPQDCPAFTDNFVEKIVMSLKSAMESAEPRPEMIRAVLKNQDYMKGLKEIYEQAGPDKKEYAKVLSKPWIIGLSIVYVLDSPGSMRQLTVGDMGDMKLTPEKVHQLAIENMEKAIGNIPKDFAPEMPGLYVLTAGDSYEASRLLLHDMWAKVAKEVEGDLIVALPSRDMVFYTGSADKTRVQVLHKIARSVVQKEPYYLTDTLIKWTPDGWVEFRL